MHTKARAKLTVASSHLPPCGPWELNSDPQAWQYVLLASEKSLWLQFFYVLPLNLIP